MAAGYEAISDRPAIDGCSKTGVYWIDMSGLETFVTAFVQREVAEARTETRYRQPLVGFADAADRRFLQLREIAEPSHLLPGDLLPKARSVVSFFLPFAEEVVEANRTGSRQVAREWALAYVETNALINRIAQGLIAALAERGVKAAAEPATHNWDPVTLISRWSHKSVAAIVGLGSFGLHHMLITDAGCAGRFGSLVVDVDLEPTSVQGASARERCRYLHDGSCRVCVERCPVGALTEAGLDKHRCYEWLLQVADRFCELGLADVCGKCATGPCAFEPAI
jgi:epoxyqueuosine reductase QueG